MTNTSGNNILKNWNPSHEDKLVTKTRDQPEAGSLFPRSPWGGEMKRPWERGCVLPCIHIANDAVYLHHLTVSSVKLDLSCRTLEKSAAGKIRYQVKPSLTSVIMCDSHFTLLF